MDDKGSVMDFMISFLKEYNYPFINTMNSEEMCKIFHISNRCFLLSWALKLLDEEYIEVLENRDTDIEFLSDILYSLGFYGKKQKEAFFKGDLQAEEEADILHRIFKFISNSKKAPDVEVDTIDIEAFESLDVNLFPKFSKFETNLNDKATSSADSKPELVGDGTEIIDLPEGTKHELREVFSLVKEKFGSEFDEFNKTVNTIAKIKEQGNRITHQFEPGSEKVIKAVHDNLNVVQKHIENLSIINNFEVEEFKQLHDDISPLMNALAEEFDD